MVEKIGSFRYVLKVFNLSDLFLLSTLVDICGLTCVLSNGYVIQRTMDEGNERK